MKIDRYSDRSPKIQNSSISSIVKRKGVKSLFAVSDIHGWYRPFVELLEIGGLIEEVDEKRAKEDGFAVGEDFFKYKGGEVVILIDGDFLDVDSEGRKVLDLITNLERETLKNGGELIALSGNHEVILLDADESYWNKIDGYQNWIKKRPIIAIVNNILFVHGGISKKALQIVYDAKKDGEDFIYKLNRLLVEDDQLLWEVTNRNFTLRDKDTLKRIMDEIGIDYMVVGHASTYGKKRSEIKLVGPKIEGTPRVFNIDTEMGDWYRGFEGQKKKNGGLLFLKWTVDGGLEKEYIYRNSQD